MAPNSGEKNMQNQRSKSPLESFLGLFTEVHPGEGATVLLMTLNVHLGCF